MYTIRTSAKFRRDIKRCQKRGRNMDRFKQINIQLTSGKSLSVKHKDHFLTGNWKGHRECHIQPDWLLIYRVHEVKKEIEYVRIGTHSDLF